MASAACAGHLSSPSPPLPPPISAVGKGADKTEKNIFHCKPDRTEGGHQLLYFLPSQLWSTNSLRTKLASAYPPCWDRNKPGQSLGWDLGPGSHLPTAPHFLRFPHPRPRVKASARSVSQGAQLRDILTLPRVMLKNPGACKAPAVARSPLCR